MKYLKEIRKIAKLKQHELADMVGVARSTVATWESQKAQPDNDMLITLSKALNVTVEELLFGIKKKTPDPLDEIRQRQEKNLLDAFYRIESLDERWKAIARFEDTVEKMLNDIHEREKEKQMQLENANEMETKK